MSGKEASSDSRDFGEQRLDRKNYPYFTDEEFITYREEEICFVEKVHSFNKKLYETKIAKHSLHRREPRLVDDLKIVLCGKTGSGKSTTANTILGEEVFIASKSSNSVTNVSLDNTCTYENRRITVVDTPGIHDTDIDIATIKKEIARIAFLLKDGVHCFVICMDATDFRFTKETEETLKLIKQEGRGNFFDYCMLAYTKAESVLGTCTLRQFLEAMKENPHNCRFLEEINDRVVAVNNISSIPAEALRNRVALIEMAGVVVADNIRKGNPVLFTNDVFDAAGTLHKKIASIVRDNNFHLALINATIETIINDCSSMLPFDVFLKKVIGILTTREMSEKNSRIPDLFSHGTKVVNEKYVNQVKQIYVQTQPEVNVFMKTISPLLLALAAAAATAGAGAGAGAAAVATVAGGAAVAAAAVAAAAASVAAGGVIGVLAALFSVVSRK